MTSRRLRDLTALLLVAPLLSCNETSTPAPSVTQPTPSAASCAFAISPASASFPSSGGTQVVNVTTSPAGCSPANWTAIAGAGLTLSAASGSGNGSVTVTAEANAGTASRTATATIASQSFTATLQARGCTYSFTADAPDTGGDTWAAGASAGDRFVTVTVSPNDGSCPAWRASSAAGWLAPEPATSTRSARVQVEFEANTGAAPRAGQVSFARPDCTGPNCGATVTVNQSAPATFALNLTLIQGEQLTGTYGGVVDGPNGYACAITTRDKSVACPAQTFANGAVVDLRVRQTTMPGDGNIFHNTTGCDAILRASDGTAICRVNMNAPRDVVIGVGCGTVCVGLR